MTYNEFTKEALTLDVLLSNKNNCNIVVSDLLPLYNKVSAMVPKHWQEFERRCYTLSVKLKYDMEVIDYLESELGGSTELIHENNFLEFIKSKIEYAVINIKFKGGSHTQKIKISSQAIDWDKVVNDVKKDYSKATIKGQRYYYK